MHLCAGRNRGRDNLERHPQGQHLPPLLQDWSLSWSLPIALDWLASQSQGPSYRYFPVLGLQCVAFSHGFWGLDSVLFAQEACTLQSHPHATSSPLLQKGEKSTLPFRSRLSSLITKDTVTQSHSLIPCNALVPQGQEGNAWKCNSLHYLGTQGLATCSEH